MDQFGGNIVTSLELDSDGEHLLCSDAYEYIHYLLADGDSISKGNLRSATVYIIRIDPSAAVHASGIDGPLQIGDVLQYENETFEITVTGGHAAVFISGTHEPHMDTSSITRTCASDIYRVTKPWGYELWLNGQHPGYAFKKIFIKAGTKTSLQYHQHKRETNLLFEGDALLHFKSKRNVPNDSITPNDVASAPLSTQQIVDVPPQIVHRIEAVTDIMLFETSTPHLDDVIRISDDTNRPDGRLENEHQ